MKNIFKLLDFARPSAPPIDNESFWTSDDDGPRIPRLTRLQAKKKIFIRKIEVTLNGTPIDQVEDNVSLQETFK